MCYGLFTFGLLLSGVVVLLAAEVGIWMFAVDTAFGVGLFAC